MPNWPPMSLVCNAACALPASVVATALPLLCPTPGAPWSSCSPDFGTQGVIDRFGQIEPKVLIAAAGYRYAGKNLDLTAKLNEILERLPSLEQLIVAPYSNTQAKAADFNSGAKVALWQDFYQPRRQPEFTHVTFH